MSVHDTELLWLEQLHTKKSSLFDFITWNALETLDFFLSFWSKRWLLFSILVATKPTDFVGKATDF